MTEPLRIVDQSEGQATADETLVIPHDCDDAFKAFMKSKHWPMISNVEAEAAFLGALMIENSLAGDFAWLEPEAFFEPLHAKMYATILRLVADGSNANPVTMKPILEHEPAIKAIGGVGYLAKLIGSASVLVGVRGFARQIEQLFRRRKLFEAMIAGAQSCAYDWSSDDVEPILEAVDEAVAAGMSPAAENAAVGIASAWDAAVSRYDQIERGEIDPGLKVDGLDDFNDLLGGGMRTGNLIVIAGRPAMGKTAVAVTIASTCARANIATAFFSLEMSRSELIERQIADICFEYGNSFTYEDLKNGKLQIRHRRQIDRTRELIADWPLIYDDTAEMKVGHLAGKMRRLKRRWAAKGKDLKVVIIDYLQLLGSDRDYKGNKNLEVSEITRTLKVTAKQLGLTIILLSQLSRAVEQREDKRPMLSDLRDSGSIEQDADAVIFLYRDEYYLKDAEPKKSDIKKWEAWQTDYLASRDKLDLIAAKVRGYRTGKRQCHFFGAHQAVRGHNFFKDGGR